MKKITFLFFGLFLHLILFAQIPAGYYDPANGLSGLALKTALHNIIKNHNSISYTSIWTYFQQTDKKANGKVWDMYSDVPGGTPPYEYSFSSDQCGSYGGEGDCYNREHSWPQSWFNSSSPMVSDLFHIYATDGYVNGKRSDYPYGDVSSPSWTSQNGGKLGPCTYPGYSGTVFEPIDAYKGDIARSFFYMSVRYYTEDASWQSSDMVTKSEINTWAINQLYVWHITDTVSQKEIDRNNAIYGIQNNRNPFIDHPEYVEMVWGAYLTENMEYSENIINIDIFPNPASSDININFNNLKISETSLYSMLGEKTPVVFNTNGNSIKADIAFLPQGIYVLKIRTSKGESNKLIIKQ